MTDSELINSGYRKYSPRNSPWSSADACYQRCVRSEDGSTKLYFINVGMWDFTKFGPDLHIGWEAEAHFCRDEHRSFRLHVPIKPEDTIEDIEAVFAEFYGRMGCVPDIYNQD